MDFNTIGSIVAIIVGVCALGISIWQGIETRKNNRLSVIPRIVVLGNWITSEEITPIGIIVENRGIGPAIITDIEIKIDNQTYNPLSNPAGFESGMKKIISNEVIPNLNFHYFSYEETISPGGGKQPFIWLTNKDNINRENTSRFIKRFSKIEIIIKYKSIYGKTFTTEYKDQCLDE